MLSKREWEQTCLDGDGWLEHFPPIRVNRNYHLVIYGAGYGGLMFLELLRRQGIEPECILDVSPQKYGRRIMGVPVFLPDDVCLAGKTVIVCLLKMGETYQQIKEKLTATGCQSVFHLYELREDQTLFENQPLVISPNRKLIWDNRDLLYHTYEMLEDELSRKTLFSIFKFLWSNLYEPIPSLPMEEQYFANDIYSLGKNDVFVDCGAHIGEIMLQFFQRTHGQFNSYWAFEPDPQNIRALEDTCPKKYSQRVIIQNSALGDTPGIVQIKNYDGSNSVICKNGQEDVPCVTLDNFTAQLHPTILKVDVEGWESRLLTGAQKMICQDKPIIAIAVYHKEQDFWEIPLQLKQWVPEYRLYLRSYLNVSETVLYAIPPERVRKKEIMP